MPAPTRVGAGKLITLLYFFAIYPILLMYSVAITNTVESLMVNQLGLVPPPRVLLSLLLIVGLMTIVRFGEKMIVTPPSSGASRPECANTFSLRHRHTLPALPARMRR